MFPRNFRGGRGQDYRAFKASIFQPSVLYPKNKPKQNKKPYRTTLSVKMQGKSSLRIITYEHANDACISGLNHYFDPYRVGARALCTAVYETSRSIPHHC